MELNVGLTFSAHFGSIAYGFTRPTLASELTEKAKLAVYGIGDSYTTILATCALVHSEMQRACVDPIGKHVDWNEFLELYQKNQFPVGLLAAVLMGFGIKVTEDIRNSSHDYLRQKVKEYEDHAAKPFDAQKSYAGECATVLLEETRHCRSAVVALRVLPELLEDVSPAPLNGTGDVIEGLKTFYQSRLEEVEPLFADANKAGFRKDLKIFYRDFYAIQRMGGAYQIEPLPETFRTPEETANMIRALQEEIEQLEKGDLPKKINELRDFLQRSPDLEPVRKNLESMIDDLEASVCPIAAFRERIEALSRPKTNFVFADQPKCPELHYLKPAGFPSGVAGTPKAKFISEARTSGTLYRVACYPELFFMDELLFLEMYPIDLLRRDTDYFFSRVQFNQNALKQDPYGYQKAFMRGDVEGLAETRKKACATILMTDRFVLYRKRIADRERQKNFFMIDGVNHTFVDWCLYWIYNEEGKHDIEKGKSIAEAKFPENLPEEQRNYMAAMMFFPTIIDYLMRDGRIDQVNNAMEFFGFEHSTGRGMSKAEQKLSDDILKPAPGVNLDYVKNTRILVVNNKAHMVINLSDPIVDIITGEDVDISGKSHQWIKLSDLAPEAQGWYGDFITRLHQLGTIACQASRFVAFLIDKGDTDSFHWMWRAVAGIIMNTPDPKKALTLISKWMVSNHEAILFFNQLHPFVLQKPRT